MRTTPPHQQGFTHIELMIAVAIAAILTAVAMPQIGEFMQRQEMLGASNALVLNLNFTRQQAVTSHQRIVMCPSATSNALQPGCLDSNQWQHGWLIFIDANGNNQRDDNEQILRSGELSATITASSGGRKRFRFMADGTALGNTGSIRMCIAGTDKVGYRVIVSNVGRVRSEQDGSHCG